MELYVFGFNGHAQFNIAQKDKQSLTTNDVRAPQRIKTGRFIKVTWASWCDCIIAIQDLNTDDDHMDILYLGQGLTETQAGYIKEHASGGATSHFGNPLLEGLQGIVQLGPLSSSIVTSFDSGQDVEFGTREVTRIENANIIVRHVSVTGGGHVTAILDGPDSLTSTVVTFDDQEALKAWLRGCQSLNQASHALPTCTRLLSNATTTIALTTSGQVYTWTQDPRFSQCLGRQSSPDTPSNVPIAIPYLSEIKIVRIASGGYMSAAVSEDGELFVWGQACPGTETELKILRPSARDVEENDDEQDEFVKCVPIRIGNSDAQVTDVAIGSGHMLVSAVTEVQGQRLTAAFAAGQNESGQLGLGETREFVDEFTEIQSFRGMAVRNVRAAGWSSWIVVETVDSKSVSYLLP